MPSELMPRRDFCASACHAASLATLVALVPACGGGRPTSPTSPIVSDLPIVTGALVQGALPVTIGAGSPLASPWNGALTQVTTGGVQRNVLLMRTGAKTFTALNGVCTHEGCTVSRSRAPRRRRCRSCRRSLPTAY